MEQGLAALEQGQYEQALERFVEAYENGEKKEEIMNLLMDCFWTPNAKEFKRTYEENSREITGIPYENLPLVFFPVSDERFYIFDLEQEEFCGILDLTLTNYKKNGIAFEGILAADCWDCRKIREMQEEQFQSCIYVIPSNEGKYVSFLQVPGFSEKYMSNHLMFHSIELMEAYFNEEEMVYLPHKVRSNQDDYYWKILDQIHEKRIRGKKEGRNHVFLSVCIPSWNRGREALRAVKALQSSRYDAELEIIVSDNGSDLNTEGYEEIRNMRDNRIVYHRFERNMGVGDNITKVLELATGEFAVLQSDQDTIILEQIGGYLNHFGHGLKLGAGRSAGEGSDYANFQKAGVINDKMEICFHVLNANYLTGNWMNVENLHKAKAFDYYYEKARENEFVKLYPHIFYMLMAVRDGDKLFVESKHLWKEGSDSQAAVSKTWALDYCRPEARMEQAAACIQLVEEIFKSRNEELSTIMVARINNIYRLLSVTIYYFGDEIQELTADWQGTCDCVFAWSNGVVDQYRDKLSDENRKEIREKLLENYTTYCNDEKITLMCKRKKE